MRETLYFKDDDSRLSFLQGNFITLTNMSQAEIDRIIEYRLSPINISVHTTNPQLRIDMLRNRKAGRIFEILKSFHEAKLEMNCQIVLVPGVNDKEELDRTLNDLASLYPSVESVAIVPIGITKYREGLAQVQSYDAELASQVLDYLDEKQAEFSDSLGTRFAFASDEFFALTSRELPGYDYYEGFPQLENGVGLMKLFESQINEELSKLEVEKVEDKKIIIATGTLAYDFMKKMASNIEKKFSGLQIELVAIKNDFFGHKITVSGLITGNDLYQQLKERASDLIIIPKSMMKADEDIFLDNFSLEEISEKLARRIRVSPVEGKDFIEIIEGEVGL